MNAPVIYQWSGDAMVPQPRFAKLCDRQFVVGQDYRLEEIEERSQASHSHYFAALHDAWGNLSDDLTERFPTVERLRKYALIKAGFADERSIVCASDAEAQSVGAFIRPLDEFAIVVIREATVKVFTAQSQSMRAMGKADFEASKRGVLDVVSSMIGVTVEQLAAQSRPRQVSAPALAPEQQRLADCQGEHPDETALAGVGRGRT